MNIDVVWVTYTYPGNDNVVQVTPYASLEQALEGVEHDTRCFDYGVKSIVAKDKNKNPIGSYHFKTTPCLVKI